MSLRICTICARGGSKGLKNKNIRELWGKPLLAYSIEQAKESGLFEAVVVSSDSEAILDEARKWKADFAIRRPDEMATDTASKLPAIIHAVKEVEKKTGRHFDVVVELDPTSPLRSLEDIREAVKLQEQTGATNVITAAPARHSPYFNMVEVSPEGIAKLSKALPHAVIRRQDSPKCYDMNASIYVWKREPFFQHSAVFYPDTRLYVMPPERSVDIDSEIDFELVKLLMQKRRASSPNALIGDPI